MKPQRKTRLSKSTSSVLGTRRKSIARLAAKCHPLRVVRLTKWLPLPLAITAIPLAFVSALVLILLLLTLLFLVGFLLYLLSLRPSKKGKDKTIEAEYWIEEDES